MTVVGRVAELWRYPIKSMAGEPVAETFVGRGGVQGDRRLAFADPDPAGFPLTARTRREMLLHRPFLDAAMAVRVRTPDGTVLAADDPRLAARLAAGSPPRPDLALRRSADAQADCHPLSLISLATVQAIGRAAGRPVDRRRFRANVYLDLGGARGFAEDDYLGWRLRLGDTVMVDVLERDTRCAMVDIDPATLETTPDTLRAIGHLHGGEAGIYGAVLAEGNVRVGDPVAVVK